MKCALMCTESPRPKKTNQAVSYNYFRLAQKNTNPGKSNNCPAHLRRTTPPIKHSETRLHLPKPIHKGEHIVITFGESRHPGDCSDYHNTSQPAIACAKKLIFSNYI